MVEQCIDVSTPDVQHSAIKFLMFRRLGELCSAPVGGARQPGRSHCGHSGRHIVRRQLAPFLGGGSRAGGCSFTELHLFQGLPHNTLCSLSSLNSTEMIYHSESCSLTSQQAWLQGFLILRCLPLRSASVLVVARATVVMPPGWNASWNSVLSEA